MFSKIIVGVDGTAQGVDAVALADALADLCDAELLLVHCHAASVAEGAAEILDDAMTRCKRPARAVSCSGIGPAHGLADVAREEDADLIVIGASHRGRFEQIFVGDVTSDLLDNAECSVAVASHGLGAAEVRFDTIAVAVDETTTATNVAHLGAELAAAAGSSVLRLVHVDKPPAPYVEGPARASARSVALEQALEPVQPDNAAFELRVGNSTDELTDLTHEVDLVLLGPDTRDSSRARCTSRVLAHTAYSPVIVCLPTS